jgi:hypothetical protein
VDAPESPDLVVCSATAREGSTPVYRLLWNARPDLKARFVLLASPEQAPEGRRGVVLRPVTAATIAAALARCDRIDPLTRPVQGAR